MRYQNNPKLLKAVIATNVSDEKILFVRLAPLFVKNMIISAVYRRYGDRIVTSTLSNLGKVTLPGGCDACVKHLEFHLGVPYLPMFNCAAVSYNGETRLLFTGNTAENEFVKDVIGFLVENGLPVTVESNYEEY